MNKVSMTSLTTSIHETGGLPAEVDPTRAGQPPETRLLCPLLQEVLLLVKLDTGVLFKTRGVI